MLIINSESSRYKAALVGKTANQTGANDTLKSFVKNTKIVVPLKYLSNFWRSLEMPLINCKIHIELNWIEDCILSSAGNSTKFKITDPKSHVPIVTLSTKDNVNLTKQLSNGFRRTVFRSSYRTIPAKVIDNDTNIYVLLRASLQSVRKLFVHAHNATDNNEAGIKITRKYFPPRGEIKDYNVFIDGRNFCDQPINDLIKQYDEVRKVSTGQGDDYITGCLLGYAYFKDNYRLITFDLSKQKALDTDPRAIQQVVFKGKTRQKTRLYTILEKSKETVLEVYKGTAKVL